MVCVLQNPSHRLRVKQSAEYSEWQLQRSLHLSAVAYAGETPVAEVLAVIGHHAIVILAEARAGAPDNLVGRIWRCGVVDDAYGATDGKSRQGHLLDRSALPELSGEARVMHYPTASDIHAMMTVPSTRRCQVGAERRFLVKTQRPPRVEVIVIGHCRYVAHLRFSRSHVPDQGIFNLRSMATVALALTGIGRTGRATAPEGGRHEAWSASGPCTVTQGPDIGRHADTGRRSCAPPMGGMGERYCLGCGTPVVMIFAIAA